jgi:hypothetical protein
VRAVHHDLDHSWQFEHDLDRSIRSTLEIDGDSVIVGSWLEDRAVEG